MHDSMQYNPILRHLQWELAKLGHYIEICFGRIFYICPIFVSRYLELGRNVSCEESTVIPTRS